MARPYGSLTKSFTSRLKRYPVLAREEEAKLTQQFHATRDPQAERRLIEGNLWLVLKIARGCCFRAAALPDLIQEGVLGLMKSLEKYDPGRGVRVSTYAAWWIRAYVYQYAMNNLRVMRLVRTVPQRKLFFALRREQAKARALGERCDPAALAARLAVPVEDVIEMEARLSARDVPLSVATAADDGAGREPRGAELRDDREGPEELASSREVRQAVRRKLDTLIDSLRERERFILEERLTADEPLTLQEVGRRFGISRERVRQLENRLKVYLQNELEPIVASPRAA